MTMRRILSAALLLAWPSFASADRDQVAMMQMITNDAPQHGSSFTGPGDLQTFANFWSMGCLKGGFTGKAFRLRGGTSNTTADFSCQSNGQVASAATFCSGQTCKVEILYDQAGTCDLTSIHSGTAADESAVNLTGLGGQPSVNTSPTVDRLQSSCTTGVSMPVSFYNVDDQTSNSNFAITLHLNSGGNYWLGHSNVAGNAAVAGATTVTKTASDNAFHTVIATVDSSANATLTVDGGTAASGGLTVPTSAPTQYCVFQACSTALSFTGQWVESGVISGTTLNSTQIGALNTNIRSAARWNF